jgi:hypothetical protein
MDDREQGEEGWARRSHWCLQASTMNAPAASAGGGNGESGLASCPSSVWSSSDEVRGATPKGHASHVGRNKPRVAVRSRARGLPSHDRDALAHDQLFSWPAAVLSERNWTQGSLNTVTKSEFIYVATWFRSRAGAWMALCARCGLERAAHCHMHTLALLAEMPVEICSRPPNLSA